MKTQKDIEKLRLREKFLLLISKYDSNWYYCECKSKYGNEVLDLLKEFVEDLEKLIGSEEKKFR